MIHAHEEFYAMKNESKKGEAGMNKKLIIIILIFTQNNYLWPEDQNNISNTVLPRSELNQDDQQYLPNNENKSDHRIPLTVLYRQDLELLANSKLPEKVIQDTKTNKQAKIRKKYTIITYMAADNDLAPFARKNLKQQADVGSTPYINVVTQLDTRIAGNKKITKRYYIEKDKLIVTNQNDPKSQHMDSGHPNTLIDCCKWAIESYPAENYILVIWNHGTGALDIGSKRTINPFPLFVYNSQKKIIELDRSIPFFDFLKAYDDLRAICFDDTTGHYLSNQDLATALEVICTQMLKGKKLSLICFDACLMSMIEITNIIKKYAEYMTASQEVVLGPGYNYQKLLAPFLHTAPSKEDLVRHIVSSYEQTYGNITNDFTQSGINLTYMQSLEENIAQVARILIECLTKQRGTSVLDAIKLSRHKMFCTHFDEPSYIDLHHFYINLREKIKDFAFTLPENTYLTKLLHTALQEGIELIHRTIVLKTAGKNLANAHGISIYFPERRLHSSYHKTTFAQTNDWFKFLKKYLSYQ